MGKQMDLIGVELENVEASGAGGSVWWCGGGRVAVDHLSDALKSAGFVPPAPPSPVSALTRAMRSLAGQHDLSRMLGEGDKRIRGSRALVEERRSGNSLDYAVALRARIEADVLVIDPEDEAVRPETAAQLRAAFEEALREFTLPDVTSWLVRVLRRLDAVSLRDAGGVYYIPPRGMGVWSKLSDVLRVSVGLSLYTMPTMRSAEAAEAIFNAVAREMQDLCVAFADETAEGGLGQRALNARKDDLRAAREKLVRYEALLERSSAALHSQLDEVDNALTAAILLAEADADSKAA